MISPEAILLFADRMKRLLRQTYDEAWRQGVDGYEPDADPTPDPSNPSTLSKELALAGLSGTALALALRKWPYEAPANPAPVRRALALAPAFQGINAMITQLAALGGGANLGAYLTPGDSGLSQWAQDNAWRLGAGESVAWAGEQAGRAEAAAADGQLLYSWMSVGDNRTCPDCELLTGMPPMALSDWPTSPGAGDTECSVGCRCTWDTWAGVVPDNYTPDLSPAQQDLLGALAERQAEMLDNTMADAAYLE